jgi:hypothetical protein
VRAVVPIRLSDAERGQISAAAERLGLTLSGFLRQAGLQASAVVESEASGEDADTEPAPERPLIVLEFGAEQKAHYVDGEKVERGL